MHTALSEPVLRKHYLSELSLVRLREARREAEQVQMVPSSLYEEVRQRNRLDRLRRACRQGSLGYNDDVTRCHSHYFIFSYLYSNDQANSFITKTSLTAESRWPPVTQSWLA